MLPQTIYVVKGATGEHWERYRWTICAFENPADCLAMVDKLNKLVVVLQPFAYKEALKEMPELQELLALDKNRKEASNPIREEHVYYADELIMYKEQK